MPQCTNRCVQMCTIWLEALTYLLKYVVSAAKIHTNTGEQGGPKKILTHSHSLIYRYCDLKQSLMKLKIYIFQPTIG